MGVKERIITIIITKIIMITIPLIIIIRLVIIIVRSKFASTAELWAWSEIRLERVPNRVMLGMSRLGSGAWGLV